VLFDTALKFPDLKFFVLFGGGFSGDKAWGCELQTCLMWEVKSLPPFPGNSGLSNTVKRFGSSGLAWENFLVSEIWLFTRKNQRGEANSGNLTFVGVDQD